MQFTKLFSSILDSTIWQEAPETKLTWITMLAMADRQGEVHASVPGLAKRAGVTIEQCEAALHCLMSPDQYSRTSAFEGRRIAAIDGGWELLNHSKYRALLSAEERKEYNRKKQAEYRANKRKGKDVNDVSMTVNDNKQNAHSTEAEAEADTEASKNTPLPPKGELPFSSDEFAQAWEDYKQHRREKRKSVTPLTQSRAFKQLAEWGEARAIAAINHSIANGWTGIFEPDSKQDHRATKAQREFPSNVNVDDVPDL